MSVAKGVECPWGDPPILTAEEMRGWDRLVMEGLGVAEAVLIEAAGRAAADAVDRLHPSGRIALLVGRGNNGADALVAARTLAARGREVVAITVGDRPPDRGFLHGWPVAVRPFAEAKDELRTAAVIVDGLLGTGSAGAPRGEVAEAIVAANDSGAPIVALDGPSGVDLSDGSVPGVAIQATTTLAFAALKLGLIRFPGRGHAGRVLLLEVGFPPAPTGVEGAALITSSFVRGVVPPLRPDAHKGTQGRVVVLAGRPGMGGAAVLAAMGAARAGAGLVHVVSHGENRVLVQQSVPEALFTASDESAALDAVAAADAVVAGPAFGTGPADAERLTALLAAATGPVVLDADALTLLAAGARFVVAEGAALVLTPHPGELARLLDTDTASVILDPFAAAEACAERFGAAVLLKGAPAVVAAAGAPTRVNVRGHSGVATAGMGDTLAGVVGALLAAGCEGAHAAAAAIYLAGAAAEHAGRGRSLLPRDVAEALPLAFAEMAAPRRPLDPGVLLDISPAE